MHVRLIKWVLYAAAVGATAAPVEVAGVGTRTEDVVEVPAADGGGGATQLPPGVSLSHAATLNSAYWV